MAGAKAQALFKGNLPAIEAIPDTTPKTQLKSYARPIPNRKRQENKCSIGQLSGRNLHRWRNFGQRARQHQKPRNTTPPKQQNKIWIKLFLRLRHDRNPCKTTCNQSVTQRANGLFQKKNS